MGPRVTALAQFLGGTSTLRRDPVSSSVTAGARATQSTSTLCQTVKGHVSTLRLTHFHPEMETKTVPHLCATKPKTWVLAGQPCSGGTTTRSPRSARSSPMEDAPETTTTLFLSTSVRKDV